MAKFCRKPLERDKEVSKKLTLAFAFTLVLSGCAKSEATQADAEAQAIQYMVDVARDMPTQAPLVEHPKVIKSGRSANGRGWDIELESGACRQSYYVEPGKEIDLNGATQDCEAARARLPAEPADAKRAYRGNCMRLVPQTGPPGPDGPGSWGELQDTLTLSCLTYVDVEGLGENATATLVDERGARYQVRIGTDVGENTGKITRITPDRIEINQIVPDGNGGWREFDAYLSREREPLTHK
jgi:Tfp pilus assembly protein PilP